MQNLTQPAPYQGSTRSSFTAPKSVSLVALPKLQIACVFIGLALSMFVPFDGSAFTVLITAAILLGGLPHGAFDIHVAAQRTKMRPIGLFLYLGFYVGLLFATVGVWFAFPDVALVTFFAISVAHFREDWSHLSGMESWSLGAAPLCTLALFHRDEVRVILEAMASPMAAQIIVGALLVAALPTLWVSGVTLFAGIWRWRDQHAAAFLLLLASLPLLPVLLGFFLFFCVFHSPRHLVALRRELDHIATPRFIAWGLALSALALALSLLLPSSAFDSGSERVVGAFQLLAALLIPHHFAPKVFSAMLIKLRPLC